MAGRRLWGQSWGWIKLLSISGAWQVVVIHPQSIQQGTVSAEIELQTVLPNPQFCSPIWWPPSIFSRNFVEFQWDNRCWDNFLMLTTVTVGNYFWQPWLGMAYISERHASHTKPTYTLHLKQFKTLRSYSSMLKLKPRNHQVCLTISTHNM